MKFLKYIFIFMFISCQKELTTITFDEQNNSETILAHNQEYPEYPNGQGEMFKFLYENINYRKTENFSCSKVMVQFTIKKNGKVDNVNIYKGADLCPILSKEIIKVFYKMPKWKAGKIDGKLVDVNYFVPLRFEFDAE